VGGRSGEEGSGGGAGRRGRGRGGGTLVVYVLTSEPREVHDGSQRDTTRSSHGKDLLIFSYSACDIHNLLHDRLERRRVLRLFLVQQRDLFTEFPWVRHDGSRH